MRFSTGIVVAVLAASVGTTPAGAQTVSRIGPSIAAIAGLVRGTNSAYDFKNSQYLVVSSHGNLNGVFVTADGVPGTPFPIQTPDVFFNHFPAVAYSPDAFNGAGGFLVTWHQSLGSGAIVHARLVSSAGALGADITVSAGGSWWEAAADVAYSTTSKEFLVVWQGVGITAQRIGLDGQLIGGNFNVTAAGYRRDPAVVYNPTTNQFLVGFGGEDSISPLAGFQRVAAGSGALVGPETVVGRARGVYIAEVAYNSATNQYLVAWYQGGTFAVLVDANGNVLTSATLLSTTVTAYDALGIDYNASSGSFLMVSHRTDGFQDGAVEIRGGLVPDVPIIATAAVPTNSGNFYPKVSSRVGKPEWLLTTATGFGATTVQRLASGPPPPPPPPTASLTANQTMPVTEGKVIVWTAVASGGAGPYTYQFWRYMSESGWVMDQDWSSVNTYGWAPTAGTRAVQVRVRNGGSTATFDAYAGSGLFTVTRPAASVTSLTSNVSFPSAPNVPITFTAQAMGGVAPLQYQFWLFREGVGWSIVQAYSSYNTYTWYPVEGNYAFQVWVRGTGSTAQYEDWRSSGFFSIVNSPGKISSLTANRTFPSSPDTSVTWTAQASGGNGPLDYKFWLFSTVTGWSVLQDWSSSNQLTWTPGVPYAGQHVVQAWVRTHGSAAQYEDYRATDWFSVTNSTALTLMTSLSLSNYSVANGCVLFSASTTGPGVWEYQFWTYANGTWTVGQTYSSLYNTFNYCPTAGTYAVQVWTRQAGSVTGLWERYASTGYFVVNP